MKRPTDSIGAFKSAVADAASETYELQLYIAGTTPRSALALANVTAVCESHLSGRYELVVIDVYQQTALAKKEQVIAVPTLIKRKPAPLRRLIGDLSDVDKVLAGLDLPRIPPIAANDPSDRQKSPKR